jgi:hypothetical protein
MEKYEREYEEAKKREHLPWWQWAIVWVIVLGGFLIAGFPHFI